MFHREIRKIVMLYVSSGLQLGFIIGMCSVLIGRIFFVFENKATYYAIPMVATLGSGLIGLILGVHVVVQANREYKRTLRYLGKDYYETAPGILRSSDNTRQLRMTSADFIKHGHLEVIDPATGYVLENHVDGETETTLPRMGNKYLFAQLNRMPDAQYVNHFQGLPLELTNHEDRRRRLPRPDVLIIEERYDGVILVRFTRDGAYAGDTWHESILKAQEQAKFEYHLPTITWQEIPEDINDIVSFTMKQL